MIYLYPSSSRSKMKAKKQDGVGTILLSRADLCWVVVLELSLAYESCITATTISA